MASNNLPKSPATFNTWFANFHKTFTANHKKLGFTANDLKNFNNVYKAWQQSYASYNSFNQFVNSWNKVNAQQFASLQAFVAAYWNAFQQSSNSNTASKPAKKSSPRSKKTAVKKTAAKKAAPKRTTAKKTAVKKTAAKKTAIKRTTIKKSAPKRTIKATTPKKAAATKTTRKAPNTAAKSNSSFAAPSVWLTNGKKAGQISVYVGTTKNGGFHLPNGAKSAFVQYRTTGRAWRTLTQGASFPFTHNFSGRKVWYRACWIGNNGKNGAWSKGVTFTVSAAKKAA